MPVHASIHVGQQFACPLISSQLDVLEVDIHGIRDEGGDGRLLSLEVVSYINSRKVPLSCIDNRVLKVFTDSDASCLFFEKLLNNGGAAAGIALLTQPIKSDPTSNSHENPLEYGPENDLEKSVENNSSSNPDSSTGSLKSRIGDRSGSASEIESRSDSKVESKSEPKIEVRSESNIESPKGHKSVLQKSANNEKRLGNRFLMIYFDLNGLSPSVRAVWLTVNLADSLAPCLEFVTRESDLELKESSRAALSGLGGYFLENDQDRAYMKQSISNLVGKAETAESVTDNSGLPGIGQRKKMNVLDSFTLRRSATPYERAVSRPVLSQKSSSIYKGPAPLVKQEPGSSSSSSPVLISVTTGDTPEGDVERSHSLIRQVILASFRLRGISSKTHSDYKLLYQHTFRSMVFAFRNKLNGRIELDDLQDRVQKQLSVYLA